MGQASEPKPDKWVLIQKKGKIRYILLYGFLLLGICSTFLFLILSYFFLPKPKHIIFYVTSLILFPISGAVCGWIQWIINERRFLNKYK